MPGLIQINGPCSTTMKDGTQHSIQNGFVIEVTGLAAVVLRMSRPRVFLRSHGWLGTFSTRWPSSAPECSSPHRPKQWQPHDARIEAQIASAHVPTTPAGPVTFEGARTHACASATGRQPDAWYEPM